MSNNFKVELGLITSQPTSLTEQITDQLARQQNFIIHTDQQTTALKALKFGNRDAVLILPTLTKEDFTEQHQQQIKLFCDASQIQTKEIITLIIKNIFAQWDIC